MKLSRLFVCVLALAATIVLVCPARAGAQTTITDERVWFTFILQGPIGPDSSPWRLSLESFYRSRDGVDQLDSAAVRPVLSYNINKHSSVGGGYAFAPSFPVTGGTTVEHRWFEQYVWTTGAGGGTLSARTRLEQRFIENNSGADHRLREVVRYQHPVKHGSTVYLAGYDELFVHLNDTTRSKQGVDQNRAYAGVGDALNKRFRVEVGYLNQFIPGHLLPDRMNHVLSGTLQISY
jgi:hypothetical protein